MSPAASPGFAEIVARLTGRQVRSISRGTPATAVLDDGRTVVVKTGRGNQTILEAAGLEWLRSAGEPPVPAVLGHNDEYLVIDHVGAGTVGATAAEAFGRSLAVLHGSGAPAFGSPPPGGHTDAWIGMAAMRNEPVDDWPTFYAAHRVEPYLYTAPLEPADRQAVETVCEHITELAGPAEPPARLHGDLWSGNAHAGSDGRVWLLDPAAHGGHRETDLAMLALFGYPRLERIRDAYQECAPLASGWRDRIPLHQLFPLLVHATLFGGGYARQVGAAARGALNAR